MKNLLKYAMLFAAAGMMSMSFTACSSDDDNNSSDDGFNIVTTTPIVDQDTYPANTNNHKDKSFGQKPSTTVLRSSTNWLLPIRPLPHPHFPQSRRLIFIRCLRTSWTR